MSAFLVDQLCLDDIGAEKQTEWKLSVLYQILDSRLVNQKATWFTSNYDLVEINRHYAITNEVHAARITSRLNQMCLLVTLSNGNAANL